MPQEVDPGKILSPVYLAGYRNSARYLRHPENLLKVCNVLGNPPACVVDIRRKVYAMPYPEWNRPHLEELFGFRYLWIPDWMDVSQRSRSIQVYNFERGLQCFEEYVQRRPGARVLFCSCRSLSNCHRGYLGEQLKALGYPVTSLNWSLAKAAKTTLKEEKESNAEPTLF